MVEWYDFIVAFLKDWALVIATVALAVSTYFLAKYTKAMARQTQATENLTRASIKASEALQTMPSLTFNGVQRLRDSDQYLTNGDKQYSRFSVKNVGYGHAKNPQAKATTDGKELPVKAHFQTSVIEVDNLCYWDVYEVKEGDKVNIEITFTDIRGVQYPSFHHTFVVV